MSIDPLKLQSPAQVARVHLLFKTHLDIGFTDFARNVFDRYRHQFIPGAMALARDMRESASVERFVWTTGSWLIYEFLERASTQQRVEMEQAIIAGDIAWHALPFTTHSELMDADLFRFGLGLSGALDRRFGRRTIAAKMTDVPGHTRAIVPLLEEAGVEFLHIGVNPASHPPGVPDVFCWRHHDEDHGGCESQIVVMYDKSDYGGVHVLPGETGAALALIHTGDNMGPPTREKVVQHYEQLRARFPEATLIGSTLDEVARELRPVRDHLPVVTAEIGDTWIHGVGTDPRKVSVFLEQSRQRKYRRQLLLVAEHTWGRDVKGMMSDPDVVHEYDGPAFRERRAAGAFREWEDSWQEQRDYIGVGPMSLPAIRVSDASKVLPEEIVRFKPSLQYQVFGSEDYDRFVGQYNLNLEATREWALPDFTKPGLEKILRQGRTWSAHMRSVEQGRGAVHIAFEFDVEALTHFGCPAEFVLRVVGNQWELSWRGKQASRVPEAIWLGLQPPGLNERDFRLIKMGQAISPRNIVDFGARSLHAVQAVRCGPSLTITPLDSPLVAVGQPSLLDFHNRLPEVSGGFHFNLYNNIWGTNFPMWTDEDTRFRFVMSQQEGK